MKNKSSHASAPASLEAAVSLLRARRFPEAEAALRALAAAGNGEASTHLGRLLMGRRNPEEAERCFRQALQAGESAIRLGDLAQALAMCGAVAEAKKQFSRALELAPENAWLHCAFGRFLFSRGEKQTALKALKASVDCDGNYPPARFFLGLILENLGALAEARPHLRLAAQMMPRDPAAQYQYGVVSEGLGDIDAAITAYKAALALDMNYIPALDRLGGCYMMLHQPENAAVCFRHILSLQPGLAAAHFGLGSALSQLGNTDAAITELQHAGKYPGAHLALAGTLQSAGRSEESCAAFYMLSRAEPENISAQLGLGDALRALGRLDEARDAYLRATKCDPDHPSGYRRLLSLGAKYPLPEAQEAALLALEKKLGTLSVPQQSELNFALYRYYEGKKHYDAAIKALLAANAARRSLLRYNEAKELRTMEVIASVTSASVMAHLPSRGAPSELPVFVLGMPRSGTSLVEQILAGHPDVFGAGEIRDFREVFSENGRTRLPALDRLSPDDALRLSRRYLDRLRQIAPDAKRVVDKLPWNFKLIGYIYALLPGAKIIHVRRDPMDTCFSCFAQNFQSAVPFCNDLKEVGTYYRGYEKMMAHWREVLPAGAFLDLQYESLVENPEAEVRKLLRFCNLGWDDSCLEFYDVNRPVRTASAVQVRQPMYRGAIGRWKSYATYLVPLREILEK